MYVRTPFQPLAQPDAPQTWFYDSVTGQYALGVATVNPTPAVSAYGAASVVQNTPQAQGDFAFGIETQSWTTRVTGGASATAATGEVAVACGPTAGDYALVTSRRACKYRAGFGMGSMFTARWPATAGNTNLLAGVGNPECGYYMAKTSAGFGILSVQNGTVEIQRLRITTKSSTAENVTVTIGGVAFLVAVTNGANTTVTADEIAAGVYSATAPGWTAFAVGADVFFVCQVAKVITGTVTLTATTAVGVGSVRTAGVAATETFIPQASFNVDTIDGNGPSGFSITPTAGNVFQIQIQYLGYGDTFFSVVNPDTGAWTLFHILKLANTLTSGTVLVNPTLHVRYLAQNLASTTTRVLHGASGVAFVEGPAPPIDPHFAQVASYSYTASSLTPVLSVRTDQAFTDANGVLRATYGQTVPLRVTLAASGTKPVQFYLIQTPTLTGPTSWALVSSGQSSASVDTASTGVSGGRLITVISVGKDGQAAQDLGPLDVVVAAGQLFTIAVQSAGNTDVVVSVSWAEDH